MFGFVFAWLSGALSGLVVAAVLRRLAGPADDEFADTSDFLAGYEHDDGKGHRA